MLPEAFLKRMEQQLGPDFPAFLTSLERPRAVALRFNPLKGNAPSLPFTQEMSPGSPMGTITTRSSVPVCTLTTRPAYIICRRPVPWHLWHFWIRSPVSGSATCALPPAEKPPRLQDE